MKTIDVIKNQSHQWNRLLRHVRQGMSVRDYLNNHIEGVDIEATTPSAVMAVNRYIVALTGPREVQWENARRGRARQFAELVNGLEVDLKRGSITQAQHDVMSRAIRWLAGRVDREIRLPGMDYKELPGDFESNVLRQDLTEITTAREDFSGTQ